MILFNDDPVKFGKGRHWVLFVCDPVTITLTLLNSGTTTLETQQAIEFLEGWLRAEVYLQKPTRQIITSNAQENTYDCGIWAIKNAVAFMRADIKAIV